MNTRRIAVTAAAVGVGMAVIAVPAQAAVNPVYQGLPMPASRSCSDVVVPAGVNLSGVPGTGWVKSWAKWANNGAGGDVCVRTLVYAANTKTWTIQSK